MTGSQPPTTILYGTPTCPHIPSTRAMLHQARVPYEYFDISRDEAAREQVLAINHGYASVPTLVFPDGTTLTEPAPAELKRKLAELGYRLPLSAVLIGNWNWIVIAVGVALAIAAALGLL